MSIIKTPAKIARDRKSYEQMLARLDDDEQTWAELSRSEQATEVFHDESCSLNHYGECDFNKSDWGEPNEVKRRWQKAVNDAFVLAPNLEPETIAMILIMGRNVA